jgi:endothelin-converting enzyme/putative endopeptidase
MQASTRVTPLKLALTLAFCGATLGLVPAIAQQAAPAPAAQTQDAVPLPGDDFFGHVNAEWLARTQIPADKGSWGAGSALGDATNERIVKLIDETAAKSPTGDTRRVTDFYRSFMDEAAIEAHGVKSLKPELEKIDAIKDKAALVRALASSIRADVDPLNSTNFYTENLFGIWIAQGLTDPNHYTPYILQGGLGTHRRHAEAGRLQRTGNPRRPRL